MVKGFLRDQKDCWASFPWRTWLCLAYPSRFYDYMRSSVFMVFELFFGSIHFRKLASMQMILTYRKSSELCPVEVKLIQPCAHVISQFCIYYTNSSQHPWLPICVSALQIFLWTSFQRLTSSLVNELSNKTSDSCSILFVWKAGLTRLSKNKLSFNNFI